MKKLGIILSLFSVTMLLAAAIVVVAGTDVQTTVAGVAAFECLFFGLTALNIIELPAGITAMYIGAPGSGGAGVQVINTDKNRGAYMVYATNPEFEGKTIFESFLRIDTLLTNGTNSVKFLTYAGDSASVLPTERRLDRNDKFAVTKLGFFLCKQPDGKSNGELHSYPNLTDFSGPVAADLAAIYHGRLNITIGGKRIVNGLDMQRFKKVPQTQQSAATNYDQSNLHDKLTPITPHLNIDGSANNEIEVTYPSHAGWAAGTAPAGFKHYLVMYAHGFLITQGSANI